MTRRSLFRYVAPLVAVVATASALAACSPVKDQAGACSPVWRGYVLASDHNYAGIGAYPGSDRYMCKDTPTQGVRAQVQHLRNYADASVTHQALGNPFEPRPHYDAAAFDNFHLNGTAPTWKGLEGKWAVPGDTYADLILGIYNNMRASAGKGPVDPAGNVPIMSPSELTAVQMANYVAITGNPWRPEISPTQMAQLYIDEGAAAQVRGDIAFCQSILETGWFSWPGSYAQVSAADAATAGYFDLQSVTARN